MSLDDPAFWLGVAFTTLATALGVFLAFLLDRVVERRRQDAAAFWIARHWGQAMARNYENGLGVTFVRGIVYGRVGPRRPAVQMALAEVDPRVATWWSRTTECLITAEDSFLPRSATSRRAREWVERIDRELDQAAGHWPGRSRRLHKLTASLPDPPQLTHALSGQTERRAPAN